MATTKSPAVARRQVRLALRRAREARQLTQGQIAEAMEWSLSKVMRIEKGDVRISASDLRVLLDFLEVRDPVEIRQLTTAARAARNERWSSDPEYREHHSPETLQFLQFEAQATAIRYYNNMVIPGPLQTAEYAKAIFALRMDDLDEATIRVRVETRMRRRDHTYYRPDLPEFLAILDEAVLWREVGGPAVMGHQLLELRRVMSETDIHVRVVPFAAAATIAFLGPFTIIDLVGEDDTVLYREGYKTEEIVNSRREIARHRDVFEHLWPATLDDEASGRLIEQRAAAMLSAADEMSRVE